MVIWFRFNYEYSDWANEVIIAGNTEAQIGFSNRFIEMMIIINQLLINGLMLDF